MVIDEVINTSPNIYRDTVKRHSFVDVTDGKNDTIWDTYYRDTINYETIYIETEDDRVKFVFRYYGNDEHWNKSFDSGIFICYAYDKNGQGGSEGMGNISSRTQTRLVNIFTNEFVEELRKRVPTKPIRNALQDTAHS